MLKMSIGLMLAIFLAFLGAMILLQNKFDPKRGEEGRNRWFNWEEISAETLIISFFLSAFWCFIFS